MLYNICGFLNSDITIITKTCFLGVLVLSELLPTTGIINSLAVDTSSLYSSEAL